MGRVLFCPGRAYSSEKNSAPLVEPHLQQIFHTWRSPKVCLRKRLLCVSKATAPPRRSHFSQYRALAQAHVSFGTSFSWQFRRWCCGRENGVRQCVGCCGIPKTRRFGSDRMTCKSISAIEHVHPILVCVVFRTISVTCTSQVHFW